MAALHNFYEEDGEQELANKRYGEIEEIEDLVEKRFKRFKNFAIVEYPPFDHSFIHKKPGKLFNKESNPIEKIQKEWEILRLCLPNSIYVRAYGLRPDLMRAMIVGPEGTPYHRGLFCFDIRFPSNYPAQLPELFYHSYGHYLNPNLNKNGKVVLPALNRWNAEGKTHPKRFTILQVLTTIQHSILKGNPSLDETPRVIISGERYNKDVIKQISETMLCVLQSPPMNFEEFVFGYFRTQAHHILMNYKSQMGSDERMNRLFFTLIRAFEANGTYCRHHYNKDSYDQALLEAKLHEEKTENSSFISKTANTLKFLLSPGIFGVSSFSL